jgi:hypothetical protein
MRLIGDWNWWMPNWTRTLLRIRRQQPLAQSQQRTA